MKKLIVLIALTLVVYSCKNTEEKTVEETNTTTVEENNVTKEIFYTGDFIYVADAAVLKGGDFIYGVTLNEKAKELAEKVEPVKENEFDMVQVTVKGTISPKPQGQEGWDEFITIEEIVKVSETPSKIDIKLEDSKE